MQRGQAVVEFAFVVPFLIFLFLALVYGGLLFMDYIQYNNAARAIARAAAFETAAFAEEKNFDDSEKAKFAADHFHPLTSLYSAKISTLQMKKNSNTSRTVSITIDLTRNPDLKLFQILTDSEDIQFPPLHLKPIIYTMPVEHTSND